MILTELLGTGGGKISLGKPRCHHSTMGGQVELGFTVKNLLSSQGVFKVLTAPLSGHTRART